MVFGMIIYGIYASTLKNIEKRYGYDTMIVETIYGGIVYLIASYI